MSCSHRQIPLGFTPEMVPEGQHICYLFTNDEDRLTVMSKFLDSGLQAGEKVLYLADAMTPAELLDALEDIGVDLRTKGTAATVARATPAYCPSGTFDTDEMLATIHAFYYQALAEGFTGARGTGEMTWFLSHQGTQAVEIMEYEARLTQLLREHPYTACCQYDARRFDGQTIMDVLRVHPVMIMRGTLVRNPYFVEPEVFLEELRRRRQG